MTKINILHLITGLGMGGAEKAVLDLSKYLSDEFNVYVIGLSKRDELLNEFLQSGINTTLLRKSNSVKDFFPMIKFINKFVKDNNIKIVHVHMVHSLIIASIIKIFNPTLKVVYTSHSINIGSKIREIVVWGLKPFRNVDIIFSKEIMKFFYKKNTKIIPNGIKVEKYKLNLKKNKKFTFIAIGRLERVKNHKFLLEIAKNLKDKYEFEIQIVGDGYLKRELEELIKKYKLEDFVKLLGLRNDIPQLLNKAHCLLMPSLWEGLPIVLLEAGASGLPVITTPVGSIPSLINSENGYLCELDCFEKQMIYILENYNEAKKKGEKLFETIKENFSIESVVRQHEEVYRELL